jgi:triosephosphate isomerase
MATAARRPLVAGNWKMNGLGRSLDEVEALADLMGGGPAPECDVMICPPATLIAQMAWKTGQLGAPILVGGQDCHGAASGAHTGDVAAEMLADAGAKAVIVGHSERRQDHGETDETVRAKAEAAYRAGLIAIVCVGETLAERDAGSAVDTVSRQIVGSLPKAADGANTVIAYEPVWAIGTGRTPRPEDVEEMHDAIRRRVATLVGVEAGYMRILYGGSVKPDNAATLLGVDDVDGALVGGASLKAVDFWPIIATYGSGRAGPA